MSQPGMIWDGVASISKPSGVPRDQEESKTARVRQLRPTYWVTTYWPLATGGPDPLIRVLTTRLLGGADDGILMVGAPLETCAPEADSVAE